MPMVAAAAAAAVTWVGGAAAAVTGFLAAPLVGLLGEGAAIALAGGVLKAGTSLALSALTSALFTPQIGQGGSPVSFKADPSAPISGVMGRFGVGGRQIHANVFGRDNIYLSFVVALSLGPIQAVDGFTANGNLVTFPNAQGLAANVEPYKDKMWQTYRLGLPTDAALSPPTGLGATLTEWTSAHTLPGFAQVFWTMQNNSKRASYESGVPTPLWTLLGMKVWDPRQDSTYPGGSGSQRRDRWNTWTYSENPYLHALAWVRGHAKLNTDGTVDRTKRLAGVGAPDEAIDIAAFVEGANVCDANDWAIAGEWTTSDDKWQVLAAMLQAGGGVPLNRGAQISCMVEAPRTSLLTLTGADIVGSVSLNVMASRRDRPNTIVPRVRLEAQKFEEVALGAVTASTYLAEDGGEPRTREVSYRYVGQAKQGAELAAYGLANARETLKASIPCKPHLLNLRAGDAFTVNEPELGLNGQKFVVIKRAFAPSSCVVTLDVRSETDGKHAFALGQTANPPATPSLTAVNPVPQAPAVGDWTVTVRPADTGGSQQPGIVVTGVVVSESAASVLIEHGPSASGPWTTAFEGPPTTESYVINGLEPGATYYIAVSIRSLQGVPSAQTVYGPYTAPGLVADDVLPTGPTIAEINANIETIFGDIFDLDADLAAETTARSAAITQVRAEGRTRENICPNGGMEQGTTGISAVRVSGSATSLALAVLDSPNWGRVLNVGPFGSGLYVVDWDYAIATPGQTYTVTGDAAVFGIGSSDQTYFDMIFTGPAGEDLGSAGDGPQNILLGPRDFSATGANRDGYAVSAVAPTGAGRVRARFVINCATAPTVIQVRQVKVERGGLPATAYSRDAVDADVRATVTTQSLSIIDLELQQAVAAFQVVANATGGMPAILRLLSSTGGGYGALIAPIVALINSTTGGTITALEAIGGDVFVRNKLTVGTVSPIEIDPSYPAVIWNFGAAKLVFGKLPNQGLIAWFGPSQTIANMTKANATLWLDNVGAGYFGGQISSGSLQAEAYSTDLAVPATVDTEAKASNGNTITVNWSYAFHRITAQPANQSPPSTAISAVVKLYRKLGSGSWTEVASQTVSANGFDTGAVEGYRQWNQDLTGSWTYSDTSGGTQTRQWRVEVASRSLMNFTGPNVTVIEQSTRFGARAAE